MLPGLVLDVRMQAEVGVWIEVGIWAEVGVWVAPCILQACLSLRLWHPRLREGMAGDCEVLTPSLVALPPFSIPSPHQDTPHAELGGPLPL